MIESLQNFIWENIFYNEDKVGLSFYAYQNNYQCKTYHFTHTLILIVDNQPQITQIKIQYSIKSGLPYWSTFTYTEGDWAHIDVSRDNNDMHVVRDHEFSLVFTTTSHSLPRSVVYLLLKDIPLKKGAFIEYNQFIESEPSCHKLIQLYCRGKEKIKSMQGTQTVWHLVEFCQKQIQREFWITSDRKVLKSNLIGLRTESVTEQQAKEGLPKNILQTIEHIKKGN